MLILIAGADPERRGSVREALVQSGYRSQEAATGSDAWEAVCIGHPDTVFAQYDLPEISSLEQAQRVRSLTQTPTCLFVGVVAGNDLHATQSAMVSEADDILVAPFDDERLHARIQVAKPPLFQARRITELEQTLHQTQAALRASARGHADPL